MDSISRTQRRRRPERPRYLRGPSSAGLRPWPRRCRRDAANLPDSRRWTDGRANTAMRGDGNGWVVCAAGHRHWGLFGAAGLLLRHSDPADRCWVLLQYRAPWSHHGDTWGPPGGARDSHESAVEAALREAAEECGLPPGAVRIQGMLRDDHGGWSYETLIAGAASVFPVLAASREATEVGWVPVGSVD